MNTLYVGGPCAANELTLERADLASLAADARVPDVGALASGREGAAARLSGIASLAQPTAAARFVHVASADGSFTANVPIEQALEGGLVLYELAGDELPSRFGGPFRLLFVDTDDCSVNVKFLSRIEFVGVEGSHTARCADEA